MDDEDLAAAVFLDVRAGDSTLLEAIEEHFGGDIDAFLEACYEHDLEDGFSELEGG